MQYPRDLTPNTTENIKLPAGNTVQIPKITSVFEIWSGNPVADTYNNKTLFIVLCNVSHQPKWDSKEVYFG